jgi:FecR-like protein
MTRTRLIHPAFSRIRLKYISRRLFSSFGNSPLMWRRFSFALLLMAGLMPAGPTKAASDLAQLAQAQPAPADSTTQTPAAPATQAPSTTTPDPAAPAADDTPEEPIGSVATVTGKATVKRDDKTIPLKVKDDIYLNDVVQTAASSSLGITFSDGTTFNLKASSEITIDTYVYEDGGKQNAGVFDVAKGTVAFVAAAVAKTGDMKITTPTATLGIRGTSGLVEVPAGASANSANNVNVKLYADADGRVGRIELNDRAGARLGFLTTASSGFAIRPGTGGARFAAVPISITPQMIARDTGFVRQVHSMQTVGRRVFDEQRAFRRANPGFVNPNRPIRQPGQFRPGQPGGRQNGLPGQNRPGQQQPGLQNRPGQQVPGTPGRQGLQPGSPQQGGQLQRPGQPSRTNQPDRAGPRPLPGAPGQPSLPPLPNRQGQQQPGGLPSQQTGAPTGGGQPGSLPRPGQPRDTGLPTQPGRPGLPANPAGPTQPRLSQPPGQLPGRPQNQQLPSQQIPGQRLQQPGQPGLPQQGGGQFRQGRIPGAPGLQRPAYPGRPTVQAPRQRAPSSAPPRERKQRDVR